MKEEAKTIPEVQTLAHSRGQAGQAPDVHRDRCWGSRFAYVIAFAAGRRVMYREMPPRELPRDWWRG